MNAIDLLINGILVLIMLSVGFSLTFKSFEKTFTQPKALIAGLILQMIALPLMAFLLTLPFNLPAAFKVGVIILAACPGGMTSNFLTYLLNANTALSISLTVINSLLAPFTIPILVNLAIYYFLGYSSNIQLGFWETAGQICVITLVPVFTGVMIKGRYPKFAEETEKILKWVSIALLALLFIIKFFASENMGGTGISPAEIFQILPLSVLVNFAALFSGYALAKAIKLDADDQVTLGIGVGIQNTTLSFLIASSLLGNEEMIKPALVYTMFTFFTAVIFGLWIKPGEIAGLRKRINNLGSLLRKKTT